MISTDYKMTFGYGRTDPPYGTAAFPYHRGDDWYMPQGTPLVVNGVQIGVSGQTGFVTGPHCHIGRFVAGKDTNPNSQGWTLDNPHVTDIGYDDVNGNYVGLLDAQGVRWVYLHMREKSTNVKVGDYLNQLPKYGGEPMEAVNLATGRIIYFTLLGRDGQDGRPNALNGDCDAEITKFQVGTPMTNGWIMALYQSAEAQNYINKVEPGVYHDRDTYKAAAGNPVTLAPGLYKV